MHPSLTQLKTAVTFLLLTAVLSAMGQKSPDHESLSTAQGLSQGMVFDMLQDKEGFIWVATKEGLNRYDGYQFKNFTTDPSDPNSLSSNFIRILFEDSKGRIWAGTLDAGLNIYDKKTGRFRRILHQPTDPGSLSGNRIMSPFVELPGNRVMVAAQDQAPDIISIPDDFFEKDVKPVITHLKLPENTHAIGMAKDDKENIWIGCTNKKIYLFDPATATFEMISDGKTILESVRKAGTSIWVNRDAFLINRTSIFRIFDTTSSIVPGIVSRTSDGNVAINALGVPPPGKGASFFYDIAKWQPGMALNDAAFFTFKSALINTQLFMMDRSGILWSGTNGFGLNKYNLASERFHHIAPDLSVRNIISVGDGKLFLRGWSANRWVTTGGSAFVNPLSGILVGNEFYNFVFSRKQEYWVWKDKQQQILRYTANGKLTGTFPVKLGGTDETQPMLEDSKGNIWLCGLSGALARVNAETGNISYFSINNNPVSPLLPDALMTAFYEDNSGDFWIGTEEGFAKMDFDRNDKPVITWYRSKPKENFSLSYNYVSSFLDDPNDDAYLLVCTKGGGLNRMEKASGKFSHITTKDGLPNDVVYGVLADSAGNIWGSTNRGIFCLIGGMAENQTARVIKTFARSDGLQGDEFNTNGFLKLPDGRLVFAGVNGINVFNPAEVLSTGYMPNVFITNIQLGNLPVVPGDKTGILQHNIETTKSITLSHLQDVLTLEFASLDFAAPLQNQYQYRMVGVDDEWVESGNRRSATYLHLPSGKYTFQVRGSNSQGIWSNNIAELRITMLPPWWRTWWAYVIYLLVAGLAIRAYLKFSVNRAKLRAQLNFEQIEARRAKELDTLKTRLYTNITHEFRTPLTVILGMANQSLENPDKPFKNAMQMIIRNGQSLLNLVNEMLDLSKLETGKMNLQKVNGDIIGFLRYVVESFHSLGESEQKQIHFLTDADSLYTSYDQEKIRQIVSNLLSNALKFTPAKGNVYLTVAAQSLTYDAPGFMLIIRVKDTGIGIPQSELQNIFDRFYQSDNSLTRKAGGTGIGLSLTRELVKLMDGEISVKSPPAGASKGSEFTVRLPMIKLAGAHRQVIHQTPVEPLQVNHFPAEISMPVTDPRNNSSPLILLVEDNADVVAYTASCLPEYRLSVGRDGREGLEKAIQLIPDLIITDVMMPFVDGFELCHRIRTNENTSHIPIIMLTAKADIEFKLEGLQHGADAYLEKPFHKGELQVRIKKLLEQRRSLRQYYLKELGLIQNENVTSEVLTEVVPPKNTEDAFVMRVRQAIEDKLSDSNFTVEHLCRQVFMSHSQLHRKLDALTGYSPNRFIRIIRLNKAKDLLKDQKASIGGIALDCGYNDPGYFARVFKQEFGYTPQEWRMRQVKAV